MGEVLTAGTVALQACQALQMPAAALAEKLVLGGSFTSQRPLRQFRCVAAGSTLAAAGVSADSSRQH